MAYVYLMVLRLVPPAHVLRCLLGGTGNASHERNNLYIGSGQREGDHAACGRPTQGIIDSSGPTGLLCRCSSVLDHWVRAPLSWHCLRLCASALLIERCSYSLSPHCPVSDVKCAVGAGASHDPASDRPLRSTILNLTIQFASGSSAQLA